MSKFKTQFRLRYLSFIILFLILFLGAFFRLYRINEYMTFLGDEGRDMLVVKRMIVDHKFTLLGPITSVGSMYMGPIYYYMMVPFLWIWQLNPVGPSVMVALFAIGTIFLLYKLGAIFFHPYIGFIASFLYAISPIPIIYGRSSWNPNVVPFFATLLILSILKAVIHQKNIFLVLAFFSLGILVQLHYVTFMFFPIILAIFFFLRSAIPKKYCLFSLLSFLAAYSPFFLFELRHNFVNTQQLVRFLFSTQKGTGLILFVVNFWQTVSDVLIRIFWRLVVIENAELSKIFLVAVIVSVYFYAKSKVKDDQLRALKIILLWFTIGVIAFGFYRGVIYDYYFGSLFTAPYLLTGIALFSIWQSGWWIKYTAPIIFLVLIFFNISHSPLKIEPNNMLNNTKTIAEFVLKETGGKPYNFALLAPYNSDHAYRYFLEVSDHPPVTIESPQVDPDRKTVTERLLIVCEEKVCKPLGHPLWEIAGFGRAEIEGEWNVVTVKVYSLVRYKEEKL